MDDLFLSVGELVSLSHRKRSNAQVRVLRAMGIEHRVRPDGTVAVLRAHVMEEFGGAKQSAANESEPNWGALCHQ